MYSNKRLFNPRIPVMLAGGVCFGCLAAVFWVLKNYWSFLFVLFLLVTFLNICVKCYSDIKRKRAVVIIICSAFIFACTLPPITLLIWSARRAYPELATVECVVLDDVIADNGVLNVQAEQVKINGKRVGGKIQLRIRLVENNLDSLDYGTHLLLYDARVDNINLITYNGINTSAYSQKLYYSVTVAEADTTLLGHVKTNIFNEVREKTHDVLIEGLPGEYAETAYMLMTGENIFSDNSVYRNFQLSGLAHILAVSGLHITFLIGCFDFVFRKLPIKRWLYMIISALFLLFFSGVCNFSPSVLRAVVMGLLFLFAKKYGQRPDSLTNLAISAVVILAFMPLYIFDIRFQLSFLSVLALLCLSPPLFKILRAFRLRKSLASPISTTLAATAGLLPVLSYVFHSISLWIIVTNLFAVPFAMVLFIMLLVVFFITLIIPPASVLFTLLIPLFYALLKFVEFFAGLGYSQFILFFTSFSTVIYFGCLIFPNHYCLLRHKFRKIVSFSCVALLITTIVVSNIPAKFNSNTLHLFAQSTGNAYIITTKDNKKILAGDITAFSDIENYLTYKRIRKLDAIIFACSTDKVIQSGALFSERFGAEEVWLARQPDDNIAAEAIIEYGWNEFYNQYVSTYCTDQFLFRTVISEGLPIGLVMDTSTDTILCINSGTHQSRLNKAELTENYFDIFLTKSDSLSYERSIYHYAQVIYNYKSNLTSLAAQQYVLLPLE